MGSTLGVITERQGFIKVDAEFSAQVFYDVKFRGLASALAVAQGSWIRAKPDCLLQKNDKTTRGCGKTDVFCYDSREF